VSCGFHTQNTCNYTRGSCWDIVSLSSNVYGELYASCGQLFCQFRVTCYSELSYFFQHCEPIGPTFGISPATGPNDTAKQTNDHRACVC